jgi:peptide deformylase
MALLEVKIIPDPILRQVTKEIVAFDTSLHSFLDDMYETMVASNGIGLAAPQVGSTRRLAIMDLSIEEAPYPVVTSLSGREPVDHIHKERLEMLNPKIVSGGALISSEEGCLSIPDYRDSIQRHDTVIMRAHDRLGREFEVEASGLTAFCIQHELDHLNGVLFVDHLSRIKKQFFKKWCAKNGLEFAC